MSNFFKTTILGGIIFLVPIVAFIAIIGKALQVTVKIATPLAKLFGISSIGGIAATELMAILILLLFCFIAGLAARTNRAKKFVEYLEVNILEKVPAYALLKAKSQNILSSKEAQDLVPIMARFDDSWQLAFEIERLQPDKVVIFLPGSPDPWSGSVAIVEAERVTELKVGSLTTTNILKKLGKGTAVNLNNPDDFGEPASSG
ncbi:MAG: DUF502 domain-containing protein [Deltaproteobacteria bacterium]|nr:DUF502 domain-containing protein [Deltaproteobacteria bacterium]